MRKTLFLFLLLFYTLFGYSQGKFVLQNSKQFDKVKFKLVNNLIIIPVEVNGAELAFILDSGVRKPIIFNLLNTDSLYINQTETMFLRGLGGGDPIEAIRSKNNIFKIGSAININQSLFAIVQDNLNFTPRLGIPIHGIIGYDLFKDFIIEINYSNKYIKLHNPLLYSYKACKKCETLDLEFNKDKPYFNVEVEINNEKVPVKLLIDSGGSDALWLFENKEKNLTLKSKYFQDFLGRGLSGSVYGKRSKVENMFIKNYVLKKVNVAFPDEESISFVRQFKERNGSFSGALLKRFNVIFDYPNAKITLKRNRYFSESFNYNNSGIELEQTGVRLVKEKSSSAIVNNENSTKSNNAVVFDANYELKVKPAFSIVELREGSPADRIGLKIGDILLYINNNATYNYSLQEITQMFYDKEYKKIRLKVERNGVPLTFVFRLESPMK